MSFHIVLPHIIDGFTNQHIVDAGSNYYGALPGRLLINIVNAKICHCNVLLGYIPVR